MAISKSFKERFTELINEIDGKNRTEIAKDIGITYATFSKAYNYGIIPTVPILARIADYFDISIEYLLGNTDNDSFIKTKNPESFQTRLRQLKGESGIPTVYELSRITHIHRNNIAQWLKKDYIPAIDDLTLIANLFNVSIDYLIGRTDDENIL